MFIWNKVSVQPQQMTGREAITIYGVTAATRITLASDILPKPLA